MGFFRSDLHGELARYREQQPVASLPLPDGRTGWLVTRYDDVRRALADPRLIKDGQMSPLGFRPPLPPGVFAATAQNMLTVDPPDHTRLRRLMQAAFTPRRIEALTPAITAIARQLLGAFDAPGEHDLLAEFAFPLPIAVISELVGVPPEERDDFVELASIIASGPNRSTELPGAMTGMIDYIRRLVTAKRKQPGPDLLSAMIATSDNGDKLSADELVSTVYLLLLAGFDTTANLIGNGAWLLLDDHTRWDTLRAEPDLLPKAIEEMLRYESPVQLATHRLATEDVVYAGQVIPAGSTVVISMLAANRDARRFIQPEVFIPARTQNSHLAFGHGIHHCLGAPLARVEARIAFAELLGHWPNMRLAEGFVPRWRASAIMHGLEHLPVVTG